MTEDWKETIGNTPDKETDKIFKKDFIVGFEEHKKQIKDENSRYNKLYNRLTAEEKEEILLEVEARAKALKYGYLKQVKKAILCEILDDKYKK